MAPFSIPLTLYEYIAVFLPGGILLVAAMGIPMFKDVKLCQVSGIPAAVVEANFVNTVCNLADELTDPEHARTLADSYLRETAANPEQLSADEVRRQIAQARQAVAVSDAALEQGKIEFPTWQEKTLPHYIRLKDLEGQLQAVRDAGEVTLAVETLAENLRDFRALWEEATPEERKSLALSFFREVTVYPDRRVKLHPRIQSGLEYTKIDLFSTRRTYNWGTGPPREVPD